ncbi:hypothetical protein DYQ86_18010 [Acidobacteria bacterium AB60]|nr:hypothetical protein DYQ86_18010 [Acidobacteria bacterium AB60]
MLHVLLNPAVIGLLALFLAIVWMLRDERDRTRAFLVLALVVNLFYGWILSFAMGRENGWLPWKYDYILIHLDQSLGVPTSAIARALQPVTPALLVIYQLMIPMMIAWFLLARRRGLSEAIVIAYVAEMIAGPLFYATLPACGPIYAFHEAWLQQPGVPLEAIRLSGMPNAFPSLHTATAFIFVVFARGRVTKSLAIMFFVATILATLATGEHYAIDLVAGLAFGCFAASVGRLRVARSAAFLTVVLAWSLSVRFAAVVLVAHPLLVRGVAVFTALAAAAHLYAEWSSESRKISEFAGVNGAAPIQISL